MPSGVCIHIQQERRKTQRSPLQPLVHSFSVRESSLEDRGASWFTEFPPPAAAQREEKKFRYFCFVLRKHAKLFECAICFQNLKVLLAGWLATLRYRKGAGAYGRVDKALLCRTGFNSRRAGGWGLEAGVWLLASGIWPLACGSWRLTGYGGWQLAAGCGRLAEAAPQRLCGSGSSAAAGNCFGSTAPRKLKKTSKKEFVKCKHCLGKKK